MTGHVSTTRDFPNFLNLATPHPSKIVRISRFYVQRVLQPKLVSRAKSAGLSLVSNLLASAFDHTRGRRAAKNLTEANLKNNRKGDTAPWIV